MGGTEIFTSALSFCFWIETLRVKFRNLGREEQEPSLTLSFHFDSWFLKYALLKSAEFLGKANELDWLSLCWRNNYTMSCVLSAKHTDRSLKFCIFLSASWEAECFSQSEQQSTWHLHWANEYPVNLWWCCKLQININSVNVFDEGTVSFNNTHWNCTTNILIFVSWSVSCY